MSYSSYISESKPWTSGIGRAVFGPSQLGGIYSLGGGLSTSFNATNGNLLTDSDLRHYYHQLDGRIYPWMQRPQHVQPPLPPSPYPQPPPPPPGEPEATAGIKLPRTTGLVNKKGHLLEINRIRCNPGSVLNRTRLDDSLGISAYESFEKDLRRFISVAKPDECFASLLSNFLGCSVTETSSEKAVRYITTVAEHNQGSPCLKMRALWLIGEIFRPQYNGFVDSLRRNFNKRLEQILLGVAGSAIRKAYRPELFAILNFWKQFVSESHVKKSVSLLQAKGVIKSSGLGNVYTSCEDFYLETGCSVRKLPHSSSFLRNLPSFAVKPPGQVEKTHRTGNSSNFQSTTTVAGSTGISNSNPHTPPESNRREPDPSPVCMLYDEEEEAEKEECSHQEENTSEPVDALRVIQRFSDELEDLLLTPASFQVALEISSIVQNYLLIYGNDENISHELLQVLSNRVKGAKNAGDGEIMFSPDQRVRLLWIIAALFDLPEHGRVGKIKPMLRNRQAASIFSSLLPRVTPASHREFQAIYKFWNSTMGEDVMSEILSAILSSNGQVKPRYKWLLECDEEVAHPIMFYGTRQSKPPPLCTAPKDADDGPNEKERQTGSSAGKIPVPEVSNVKICSAPPVAIHSKGTAAGRIKVAEIKCGPETAVDPLTPVKTNLSSTNVSASLGDGGNNCLKVTDGQIYRQPLQQKTGSLKHNRCADRPSQSDFNRSRTASGSWAGSIKPNPPTVDKLDNVPVVSKLNLFRQKMQKDEAIISLGWKYLTTPVACDENARYLVVDERVTLSMFVDAILDSEEWDIASTESGKLALKLVMKKPHT